MRLAQRNKGEQLLQQMIFVIVLSCVEPHLTYVTLSLTWVGGIQTEQLISLTSAEASQCKMLMQDGFDNMRHETFNDKLKVSLCCWAAPVPQNICFLPLPATRALQNLAPDQFPSIRMGRASDKPFVLLWKTISSKTTVPCFHTISTCTFTMAQAAQARL